MCHGSGTLGFKNLKPLRLKFTIWVKHLSGGIELEVDCLNTLKSVFSQVCIGMCLNPLFLVIDGF